MQSDKITRVLFLWKVEADLKKHLRKVFVKEKKIELIFPENTSNKNLLKSAKDADVIVGWRPIPGLLETAEKLRLYINPGTGIKHHINNFREINKIREVVLVNGHGHAYATAQHTAAMLLSLMNRIVLHHDRMIDGKWRTSDDKDILSASIPLGDRKIGLLGYGAINKYVHQFLSGFECEFHVLKRKLGFGISNLGFERKRKFSYLPKDLNKFLKAIDILIIAVPHTLKTEGMIGMKELRLLGKNGLLVNVARGVVVDEESLYKALKEKVITGAALDVWYNYSPKKDKKGREYPYKFPFHKLKNVLMSPHRAASPFDDVSRWEEVIENIRRFSKGRNDYLNIVDLEEEY